jgi:hypothetical protein
MPLIIWFDDGLVEHYTVAFPLMQKAGFKAVDAVITGYVGATWPDEGWRDKPCMTLQQLRELHSAGWNIVSHSVTHPHFPKISVEQAKREFINSKAWIRSQGFEDYCFAWPFGEIAYQDIEQRYYDYERTLSPDVWNGQSRLIPTTVVVTHESPISPQVDVALNKARDGYAVLMFAHGIRTLTEERDPWEITPEECVSIINQIKNSGVQVKTLSEIIGCPYATLTPFSSLNQTLCRIWTHFKHRNAKKHLTQPIKTE